MATAANPEDVYAVVKTWVETFVDANHALRQISRFVEDGLRVW